MHAGRLVLPFRGVEGRARDFESRIDSFLAGSGRRYPVGDHEDWPSILVACLRRGWSVLPLDQSIGDTTRHGAQDFQSAALLVSTVPAKLFADPWAQDGPDYHQLGRTPTLALESSSGTTAAPRAFGFGAIDTSPIAIGLRHDGTSPMSILTSASFRSRTRIGFSNLPTR